MNHLSSNTIDGEVPFLRRFSTIDLTMNNMYSILRKKSSKDSQGSACEPNTPKPSLIDSVLQGVSITGMVVAGLNPNEIDKVFN